MGEIGCGKASLIEMASKIINKGKICIHKMNIHEELMMKILLNF